MYYIFVLTDGNYIDEIIKDGGFNVEKRKVPILGRYDTGGSFETYVTGYKTVAEISIKRSNSEDKPIPIMMELTDYNKNKYKDIITGRIFRPISYNLVTETNAVNLYFYEYPRCCDTSFVADTLRSMTEEDFKVYSESLCRLNKIIYNVLYEEKVKAMELLQKSKEESKKAAAKAAADENYVKEFIKRRGNTGIN